MFKKASPNGKVFNTACYCRRVCVSVCESVSVSVCSPSVNVCENVSECVCTCMPVMSIRHTNIISGYKFEFVNYIQG